MFFIVLLGCVFVKRLFIGPESDHCLPLSLTHSLKMKSAGKTMLMVFFWRYEFQGLKTFDRTIGISFSINFQYFPPTKIRVWHGILYYAPGRKWCCETELGEVSRCESLVTLHHQSYLRTITSNFILQNISKPLLPRCTGVFCLYVFFILVFFRSVTKLVTMPACAYCVSFEL